MNNLNLLSPTGPKPDSGAAAQSAGAKADAPSSAFADLVGSFNPEDLMEASQDKAETTATGEEMMLAANEKAPPAQNTVPSPSLMFLTLAQQGAGEEGMTQVAGTDENLELTANIESAQEANSLAGMITGLAGAETASSLAQAGDLQADAGKMTQGTSMPTASGEMAKTEIGNTKMPSLASDGFGKINSEATGLSSGSETDLDQGQGHSGEQANSAAAVTVRKDSDAPKSANELAAQMNDFLKNAKQSGPAAPSATDPAALASALSGPAAGLTGPVAGLTSPAGMEALGTTQSASALPQSGAQLPQVPVNNLAVHIASQAHAGNHKFEIRLDPAELGKIDIRLEISRDGQALTHIAVEKPETLDLLRQDARALERALTGAGLDSREGALSFSLREDNRGRGGSGMYGQDDQDGSGAQMNDSDELQKTEMTRTINVASGVDISI